MISTKNNKKTQEISKLCKVMRVKIKNMNVVPNNDGTYRLVVDLTPAAQKISKIMTEESELHRIIEHLNPAGVELEGQYRTFKDIIVIKVGNSTKYEYLVRRGNDERKPEDIGTIEVRTFADSEKTELIKTETYRHLIVNASHIRSQKAFFVNTANGLYDKVDEIIRCGIPKNTKVKYITKWSSYYGLQASNSTPVTMPKCVIVKDMILEIPDKVDIVKGTEQRECIKLFKRKPNIYGDVKHFEVSNGQEQKVKTCPFDGMGLVDLKTAEKWAEDLGLDYTPGSFQVRLCGVKGCLFVMDIKKFITEIHRSGKIKDIDSEIHDFESGDFNVILTESMFKYGQFYSGKNKAAQWKKEFERELYGYRRTFNICSYSQSINFLSDIMLAAYQPLQSLCELQHIPELCSHTIDILKEIHSDIDKFLYYIGINDTKGKINKASVPPYYRALYYNHSLANDPYIHMKINRSLRAAIERTYTGKLYLNGNYTVVGSDPFALLQWAFSQNVNKVTGLLQKDEIYSNYWNMKNQEKVNVWRNPHIYTEHWIGKCKNTEVINDWFRYLPSNTIVSIWDTNLLRMNSADCDGDIVATVNNEILMDEVSRVLAGSEANTVYPILEFGSKKDSDKYVEIGNISGQILSEINGFKNDIGTCTNLISSLWGIPQNKEVKDYLKIMSVVDSLIIDFPKTSEKTDIPPDIKKYIKDNKVKKQEFMMYLPANRLIREKEEKLCKGEESLFRHDDCTLNKICRYMKKETDGIVKTFKVPEFDFKTLINSVDENIQYREVYKKVLQKLETFYRYQQHINIEKRHESKCKRSTKDDYDSLYKAFYSSCRYDMLLAKECGKYISRDIILDCCIIACYAEKKILDKSDVFDLLWNMFPDEMVQRARGMHRSNCKSQADIDKFARAIEKKQGYEIERFKKETESKRLNRIKNMKFLQDNNPFFVYKDDISSIKLSIPTAVENYIRKRKLLYVLLVSDKKIGQMSDGEEKIPYVSNSCTALNDSVLGELLNESGKTVKQELQWLEDNKFITINEKAISVNKGKMIKPQKADKSVIYFNGSKFLSGVKIMNRYLRK